MERFHLKAGSLARRGYELDLDPQTAGWQQSGLRVLRLGAGETSRQANPGEEWLALPLSGSFRIVAAGREYLLRGRPGVFAGPSDTLFLPPGVEFSVSSEDGGRIAFATARSTLPGEIAFLAAEDAPVVRRGAGSMSRRVHEYRMSGGKLLVVEVYTAGGGWSSYPPHKHDVTTESETQLEELYYYEVKDGPAGPGVAYQRVYASDERPIDVFAEVRTGDVVLIPYGWHGPAMAAPGYDLYYLNVMSGSGERDDWLISDDPAYTWVRGLWDGEEFDPRLG